MKRHSLALLACALIVLEVLLVVSCGGILNPLALVSVIPLALGVAGLALACLERKKSGGPGCVPDLAFVADVVEPPPAADPAALAEARPAAVYSPELRFLPRVYEAAVPALFKSIVDYLMNTTEPISETLVNIKAVIAEFTASVRRIKDSSESRDYTSDIEKGIQRLREHITEVTTDASRGFGEIAKKTEELNGQMTSILDIVANISDVAERVHVLSINASIEAARAGTHGRGFKVIADEIQRLAKETQSFVSTIESTAGSTKRAFHALNDFMAKNQAGIEKLVIEDSSTYDAITRTIESHLKDFEEIHSTVVTFIDSIEVDMKTLFPLSMLHAIIVQEIENLGKVSEDLVALLAREHPNPESLSRELADIESAERIRKRLTTSRELDALEAALGKLSLGERYNMNRVNTEIEFF